MTTETDSTPVDHKKLFINISVHLTGFDEAELEGTGMVETYYRTIVQNYTPVDLTYFFQAVKGILRHHDPEIVSGAIRSQLMPSSAYSGLAQKIITMWYTGAWTSLTKERVQETEIISSQAYKQGLIWTAIEAHPPGAKQPGYGSWSLRPL